jgi:hypothetical protein
MGVVHHKAERKPYLSSPSAFVALRIQLLTYAALCSYNHNTKLLP